MHLLFTAALFVTPLPTDGGAQPETYPQLISTSYPDRAKLPADVAAPPASHDFVEKAKLPAGAKVLSAAKLGNGKVWVVTDQGAFCSRGDAYVPLDLQP